MIVNTNAMKITSIPNFFATFWGFKLEGKLLIPNRNVIPIIVWAICLCDKSCIHILWAFASRFWAKLSLTRIKEASKSALLSSAFVRAAWQIDSACVSNIDHVVIDDQSIGSNAEMEAAKPLVTEAILQTDCSKWGVNPDSSPVPITTSWFASHSRRVTQHSLSTVKVRGAVCKEYALQIMSFWQVQSVWGSCCCCWGILPPHRLLAERIV